MTLEQLQVRDAELQAEIKKLMMPGQLVSVLGGIGGVVYNVKTGGSFLRGVGYYFLGSIIVATPFLIANFKKLQELTKEQTVIKTNIMAQQGLKI